MSYILHQVFRMCHSRCIVIRWLRAWSSLKKQVIPMKRGKILRKIRVETLRQNGLEIWIYKYVEN